MVMVIENFGFGIGTMVEDVENCEIYEVYKYVKSSLDSSELLEKGLFDLGVSEDEINEKITTKKIPVIPVIYQPALDSLKNYVRQIHCAHTEPNIWEISIVFNNEVLRRHRILNFAYEKLRLLMYHRVADVETLKICMDDQKPDKNNKHFVFENIFSKDFEIRVRFCPFRSYSCTPQKHKVSII